MDETRNPWKVLSRNPVYENQWIRVDHNEVIGPSGKPGIYGTVHFKNLAVGVVPLDESGNVVLVGQYRFPLGAYSWEIPEGGGSREHTPLISAQRELREECGLVAGKWMELIETDLSNSVSDERSTAFLAWELSASPAEPDEHEQLQIRRVPFWDAVELVKRGAIRDSITVSALLRMALMANEGELPPAVQNYVSR